MKLRNTYDKTSSINFSSVSQVPNYFDENLILNKKSDLFYLYGIDSSKKIDTSFQWH